MGDPIMPPAVPTGAELPSVNPALAESFSVQASFDGTIGNIKQTLALPGVANAAIVALGIAAGAAFFIGGIRSVIEGKNRIPFIGEGWNKT